MQRGFALRLTLIKDSQRLSRLLLILALAYILLAAVGLYCRERFRPGRWCSNNRRKECSLGGLVAYTSAFLAQFSSIGWAGALIAILILHFPVPFGIHLFIFWVYRDYYMIANTKIRFC
jgi:hypothetical protein